MTARVANWSFPRHRPQMYAPTSVGLQRVHRYYSFGRPLSRVARLALSAVLATPGVRRLVSGRHELELPFDSATFHRIREAITNVVEQNTWAVFQSAWHTQRLIVFSFDRNSLCAGVTHVGPIHESLFHPSASGDIVMVPKNLGITRVDEWELHTLEAIPPWHRPHPWDAERLSAIVADIERIVANDIPKPSGGAADLVPIHGDLTPWNLRLAGTDSPWLFDWEWAGWGPVHSDLLRFAIATCSLTMTRPEEIVAWIDVNVPMDRRELAPAARYWLGHSVYQGLEAQIAAEGDQALVAEHTNGQVEAAALRILAAGVPPPV